MTENSAENVYAARDQIVKLLRQTAHRIEREEVRPALKDMRPDYCAFAAEILHKVRFAYGNLPLGDMVREAGRADIGERSDA